MYASLDFIDYKIEQRTKYSKAKVYTIIDDTEAVIDLENPYIIKKRQEAIKDFLNGNIYEHLFEFDEGLLRVVIPEGVEEVKETAFRECCNLDFVIIPDSVTSLECGAFYECGKLKTIVIPDNIKYMGLGVFANCYKLKEVIYKGDAYTSKSKFIAALLKEDVTIPGGDMFYNTKMEE